jgi:hypothetical protein
MPDAADIADPLVSVRDVVETFRNYGLTVAGWDEVLETAVRALDNSHMTSWAEVQIPELSTNLRLLLAHGLGNEPHAVDRVSGWVLRLLSNTMVPGIPKPEEDYWGFYV